MVESGLSWVDVAKLIGRTDGSTLRKSLTDSTRRPSVGSAVALARWLDPANPNDPPETNPVDESLLQAAIAEAEDFLPTSFFQD